MVLNVIMSIKKKYFLFRNDLLVSDCHPAAKNLCVIFGSASMQSKFLSKLEAYHPSRDFERVIQTFNNAWLDCCNSLIVGFDPLSLVGCGLYKMLAFW